MDIERVNISNDKSIEKIIHDLESVTIPKDKIIYRSKLPDISVPEHLPLHSYCFENLPKFATRPCLINGKTGEIHTYADVDRISRQVAIGLHDKLGIRHGHVIMILLPNTPEFVFAFLAASRLGAMTTTANPFYTPAEIQKQAKASRTRVIVTLACYVDKVRDFARDSGIKIVCIDSLPPMQENLGELIDDNLYVHFSDLVVAESESGSAELARWEGEIAGDDVVALPYSSGTTGLPKGVMLTHRGLVTSVAQQVDGENPNLYFREEDVLLCVLPLFHIYSLNSVLLCGLRVGAAILIMQKFEIGAFLELIQGWRVSVLPLVPPIVLALAKSGAVDEYDLRSVRVVMSGAAPLGKELEDTVRAKFPNAKLGQGYGMTEAGPVLSMCLAFAKEPFDIKSGSCGTVVRNAEMKIVDPETELSLPRNQRGEICIRGHQIMKGYLNDPEATARTIDKDGWLHTGDIGYIDDNDELFIVDRLKELIKYKGFQVAPAELEALLINHPNISDAAVVPMKDDAAGEVPVAFVVRSNGSEIDEDDIKLYISKQVVFYKRINRVFFVDSIPKAPSGKILRKDLKAKLAAGFPN